MNAAYIVPTVGITLMAIGLIGVGAAAWRNHHQGNRLDFIRSLGSHSEHPEFSSTIFPSLITDGQAYVAGLVNKIQNDPYYGPRTLILITPGTCPAW